MPKKIGAGKLSVIKNLYKSLDISFKESLQENSNSLFRLLQIEEADMLVGFLEGILSREYYDYNSHVFKFEEHILGVTLEDVLYLTGLPIQGKPVIFPDSPDLDAYERVFGASFKEKTTLSFDELLDIAVNAEDTNRRKIAVLVILCGAFIAPSNNKHEVSSACVQFIESVDQIDTYAWGAALLSCIYQGIKQTRIGKKKCIDGNMWVVLGFFLIRLPKLQWQLGVDLRKYPQPQLEGAPLLPWIVGEIKSKTRNHYAKYNIISLMPLSDEDIIWTPYAEMQCPRPGDLDRVRDLVPLFCFNFVEHHMPHLCDKQFPEFESYDVNSVTWKYYTIPFKHRKGGLPQKYLKLHERQIKEWNDRKAAETYMTAKEREEREESEEFYDRNDYNFNSETEDRDREEDGEESENEEDGEEEEEENRDDREENENEDEEEENGDDREQGGGGGLGVAKVIELSDDDDVEEGINDTSQIVDLPECKLWYYTDPQQINQGPFSMVTLKRWKEQRYFSPGFRIWKSGHSSVLLEDMISLMFSS